MDIVVAEVVPDALGADFERELVLRDFAVADCVLAVVASAACEPADQTNPKVLRVLAFLALDVGLV